MPPRTGYGERTGLPNDPAAEFVYPGTQSERNEAAARRALAQARQVRGRDLTAAEIAAILPAVGLSEAAAQRFGSGVLTPQESLALNMARPSWRDVPRDPQGRPIVPDISQEEYNRIMAEQRAAETGVDPRRDPTSEDFVPSNRPLPGIDPGPLELIQAERHGGRAVRARVEGP